MNYTSRRMEREARSVQVIVSLYCKNHHQAVPPCPECQKLIEYAFKRLQHCPFQEQKPTCGKCRVHCYRPEMQQKIREVMRYVGPRLIWRHPVLALQHLIDGLRKAPLRK